MNDMTDVAVGIANDATAGTDDNTIITSTGFSITVKPVSSLILAELTRRHRKPRPPMWHNAEMGRDEENANDPDYIDAVQEWTMEITMGMVDTMLLLGTDASKMKIPNDQPSVDDEIWSDEIDVLGIDVGTGRKRYLAYMKYVVCKLQSDTDAVVKAVSRLSGVSEADVEAASEGIFRDNTGQRTDSGSDSS